MRSRIPLLVLALLVLAPVPLVGWLGWAWLDVLDASGAELRRDRALGELARGLREACSRADPGEGVWVALDPEEEDGGSIAWTAASGWLDHPAARALRVGTSSSLEERLGRLEPVFDDDDAERRCGARLDAARLLQQHASPEHARRLAETARAIPLPEGPLRRWQELRTIAVLDPTELRPGVESWLAELESRPTDLGELALLADVLAELDAPVLRRRLAERHRWPGRRERLGPRLSGTEADWVAFVDEAETLVAERGSGGRWWITEAASLRDWLRAWRHEGVQLAFEPTDGAAELGELPLSVSLRGNAVPTRLFDPTPEIDPRPRLALLGGLSVYVVLGLWTLRAASQHQRQARSLARERGDLIARVSHELRTPLTVIRMYAETLRSGRAPPEARDEYLRTVQEESLRLGALVDRVAEVARGEGDGALERGPIDPEDGLDAVLAVLRAHRPPEAALTVERAGRGCRVRAHPEELRRIVEILADNAVRYTAPELPLELRTTIREHHWCFELRDHGPGIPPPEREKVFERWVRGSAATHHGQRGAGMGLWLARGTAHELGGSLELEFPEDGGTLARLRLPILPEEPR